MQSVRSLRGRGAAGAMGRGSVRYSFRIRDSLVFALSYICSQVGDAVSTAPRVECLVWFISICRLAQRPGVLMLLLNCYGVLLQPAEGVRVQDFKESPGLTPGGWFHVERLNRCLSVLYLLQRYDFFSENPSYIFTKTVGFANCGCWFFR